jgi:predicted phage terminase large subunit-like protein
MVEAFGSLKRMRGRRHGPYRPDLVLLDDIENDENVRSPEQRDKLERWLTRTVLKLGPANDTMDVFLIGTILHYDSVLSRVMRKPLWESRRFCALMCQPDRMDLWERWEEYLRNDGEPDADKWYREHQADMDAGAVVSWPAQRPLLALMKIRAEDRDAFDSELQNNPVSGESAIFTNVHFWVNRLKEWIFYGACDPSLGKRGKSRDPSAILVGGFSKSSGILDIVEAAICRRLPDRIIEDIIAFQAEYRCIKWAVESVQFQEYLRQQLVKVSAMRGCPVPALPVNPHDDKELRIESLQPHVKNGLIRFHSSQVVLLDQLRHYPAADHDDGPDCLEMLWTLVHPKKSGNPFKKIRLPWL